MGYPVTLNGRTYTLADFEGTNYVEGLPDAFEDFVTHAGDIYNDTSTTSNSIGTGSKTFTVSSGKPYQAGTPLRIADAAAPSTNFMDTVVTSYSGTSLVVNSIGYGGSGTKTSWTINIGGAKTIDGTLGVSQGGTGATTAAAARTNLDVYSKADADSRFLNVSGEASDVSMTGNVTIGDAGTDTLTINAATTTTADISFGDSDKAIFGAGSDLQIYHNGTNNLIIDAGTTDSYIQTDNAWRFTDVGNNETHMIINDDGAVSIFYNGSQKFATTSAGVDITGTLVIDDTLSIDSSTTNGFIQASSNVFQIGTSSNDRVDFYANNTAHMSLAGDGELIVNETGNSGGDFRVEGDTQTHLIFADASEDAVGIGTSAPGTIGGRLSVRGDAIDTNVLALTHSGLGTPFYFNTGISGVNHNVLKIKQGTDEYIRIQNGSGVFLKYQGTHGIELDTSANVIVNNSGNSQDFRVETDSFSNAFLMDGSDNRANFQVPIIAQGDVGASPISNGAQLGKYQSGSGDADGGELALVIDGAASWSIDNSLGRVRWHLGDSSGVGERDIAKIEVLAGHNGTTTSSKMRFVTTDYNSAVEKNALELQPDGSAVFNQDGVSLSDFIIESDSIDHMFFVDSGNNRIGINNSTPSSMFHIGRSGASDTGMLIQQANTAAMIKLNGRMNNSGSTTTAILFKDGSTATDEGSITVTSSGVTYNTTSDRRLKTDIQPIADATDKLMAMNPVFHKWIANPDDDAVHGFIAQEMQEIVPESVVGEDGGDDMMSMDYGRITPVIVAALQNAINEIEMLKGRIAELEAK